MATVVPIVRVRDIAVLEVFVTVCINKYSCSVYLSVYLSIYLPIGLSICMSVCLSVCLSISNTATYKVWSTLSDP